MTFSLVSKNDAPRVLLADPPWLAKDQLPGKARGAAKKYDCLTTEQIMRFPLPVMADPAVLFLWRVAWMPQEALTVARAWGFAPKTEVVWVKTKACGACNGTGQDMSQAPGRPCPKCEGRGWKLHLGMGHHTRGAHETCIIATRGSGLSKLRKRRDIPSVLFATLPTIDALTKKGEPTRKVEHSAKPEAMADLIESLYPGPYVELFGRRERDGWDVMGNQVGARGKVEM